MSSEKSRIKKYVMCCFPSIDIRRYPIILLFLNCDDLMFGLFQFHLLLKWQIN